MGRSNHPGEVVVDDVIGLVLATHVVYLTACWSVMQFEPFRHSGAWVVAAGVLFRLLVAPAGPVLTDDPWRYQWEGRIQSEGRNPYATRPADLGDHRVPGREAKAVYGPLIEVAERLAWQWGGGGDVRWMKLPAMMADLMLLAIIAKRWPARVLFYAWSPVAILEFWGQGHNDAIALVFITLALTAPGAGVWLGLAMAAKWWPLVLTPALARSWRDWWIAPLVPILCLVPFRDGLSLENLRFTTGFLGGWRNNDSLFGLLLAVTPTAYQAKHAAFVIVGLAAFAAARWPVSMSRAARGLLVTVTMLAVSSNVHPWYLSWTLPFLVIVPSLPVMLWGALMPLAYESVIRWQILGEWGTAPWTRAAIYGPVVLAALASWWVRRRAAISPPASSEGRAPGG